MKEIPLTKGKVVIVDDEDYEWLSQWKWYYNKYAARGCPKKIYMHREIAGTPKGMFTDHKNQNKLDNRRSNLRVCTMSQNLINKPKSIKNKSGYKGVCFNKDHQKWTAQVCHNRKLICLGFFETPEDAAMAYDKYVCSEYGEFAVTNFKEEI